MSEPLHDIDKLLYDTIEEHSEYPPKKVWDKIEASLDKDTAVVYKKKYLTLRRAAVILLLLFLGIVMYEVMKRNSGKNEVAGTKAGNDMQQENSRKDNSEQTRQLKDKTLSPDQETNDNNKEEVALPDDQEQTTSSPGKKANDNSSGELSGAVPKAGTEKQIKHRSDKSLVRDEEVLVSVETPGKSKNKNTGTQLPSLIIDNNVETDNDQYVKRSFSLASAGLNKKDINNLLSSIAAVAHNGSSSVLSRLTAAQSQKTRNFLTANRGFSVQAYFLPGVAWNKLEDDKPHQPPGGGGPGSPPVQDHHEIKNNEQKSYAYSGGVKISYGLSKKVSLQAGLNYTQILTSENPKTIYAERDNNGKVSYRSDCSSGYTYLLPKGSANPAAGDKKKVSDIRNTVDYLGIPLAVSYTIASGKLSLSVSTGGQANILLKGKTSAVFDKGTSNQKTASSKTEGLKSTYFSALADITGELRLNKKLSVTMSPSAQIAVSSINSGASVKTRPAYLGLSAGIKFRL